MNALANIPDKWLGWLVAALLFFGGAGGGQVLRDFIKSPASDQSISNLQASIEKRYADLEVRVRSLETERARVDQRLQGISDELRYIRTGVDRLLQERREP